MSFYVKQLGRTIFGRDTGSNKQSASKSCALSIVRQLYHLGVIEAFSGTLKKEKSGNEMQPYDVKISPELQSQLQDCLESLEIAPIKVDPQSSDQPVSLLSSHVLSDFPASTAVVAGVVPWTPPQPNWNPWTGCNIDEGPLATANLEQLSDELLRESRDRLANDLNLQKSIDSRNHLPVFNMRGRIMEAINDNPVIIIRGNTGCGKSNMKDLIVSS